MNSGLSALLENDNFELGEKMKKVFDNPLFIPKYNISLEEERELAYKRLKYFCGKKLISVYDFYIDPLLVLRVNVVEAKGFWPVIDLVKVFLEHMLVLRQKETIRFSCKRWPWHMVRDWFLSSLI